MDSHPILMQTGSLPQASRLGDKQAGVVMKLNKKVVLHSASAAAVMSVLVSVVGAGTKWMGQ